MKKLTPLNSLTFFEEHLPEFLLTDSIIKPQIEELKGILAKEESPEYHADLLASGKKFIKHIISKSIEYLSDESKSPKNRSIEALDNYIETFTSFEEMLLSPVLTLPGHS